MKKSLSEAGMTESESQVVRKTIKQGIIYVQTLSVSITKTYLEQRIPYVVVLDVQPSELKRKSEILVEAMTKKKKRVNQQSTRLGKRQNKLLTIVESSEEEEEEEAKQVEKVTTSKQSAGKARQPWKPKIEKINSTIANEVNFVQMNKFYGLYNNIEKYHIDISTMRYNC